ncbi:LysR substrate-binding domain-containing protein [Shimia marina]|uniref:Gcv operon activator n=1 Tax=Shimia marina TaxID=321267 RepID=A0A0P1EUT0_9RHOB|nr:LysR substrate-binding domain-containing protein [Shimia marina]CUH54151.1 Gcv operon activator [Shimia marina]SFD96690.1 LysR family transcriptional regulator, glycine cleavage system transcriptional activator [Shimia marina]
MDWSALPSLSALRAFEAAARHKSLSAAARELNVTHAAIAQHVRHLEAEFGQSLLFRAGRGVAPTEAGQQLAGQLNEGFGILSDAVHSLRQRQENRPLALSVTPSFAMNWLMPRIGAFWQAHPDIPVAITPSIALVDLKRDGFDMAIRFGNGDWPGVQSTPLTAGEFWVVAQPELLHAHGTQTLQEAESLPWLMEPHLMEWRRVVKEAGLDLDRVNITVLDSNELVLSATLAGLGVSVHPRSLVERDVGTGALTCLCALPTEGLGYHVLTVNGRDSPRLRRFAKWLHATA